jgi:predicted DNA binding CopG/RHH family protein
VAVHTRFFADSIEAVKRIAAVSGLPWQVELRLIVRRALRVALLKEK